MGILSKLAKLIRRCVKRRITAIGAVQIEGLERRELPTVTFQGGPVLDQVEVQALYLGSAWQFNQSLQTQKTEFDGFLSYLVQSPLFDALGTAGYGIQHGTADAGTVDNSALHRKLTDKKIRQAIQRDIDSQLLQQPDSERLYVVYVEPNVIVKEGGGNSVRSFYGYHDHFAGHDAQGAEQDIYYAVIPYHSGVNGMIPGTSTSFDSMTEVSSHEVAEGVTDPIPGDGWYANGSHGGEIADLTRKAVVLNGYVVQQFVGQDEQPFPIPGSTPLPGLAEPLAGSDHNIDSADDSVDALFQSGSPLSAPHITRHVGRGHRHL
jgi:hypothetical protein